jgi:hypothetical protein
MYTGTVPGWAVDCGVFVAEDTRPFGEEEALHLKNAKPKSSQDE